MGGMPSPFVARFPDGDSSSDQLMLDLQTLNSVDRIAGGTRPFEVWLNNAAYSVSVYPKEQAYFEGLAKKVAAGQAHNDDAGVGDDRGSAGEAQQGRGGPEGTGNGEPPKGLGGIGNARTGNGDGGRRGPLRMLPSEQEVYRQVEPELESEAKNRDDNITKSTTINGEYVIVISATIQEVDKVKAQAIVSHLRELSNDATLTLTRVEAGSVRLLVEGTRDGFNHLNDLHESGSLTTVLGFDVIKLDWTLTVPQRTTQQGNLSINTGAQPLAKTPKSSRARTIDAPSRPIEYLWQNTVGSLVDTGSQFVRRTLAAYASHKVAQFIFIPALLAFLASCYLTYATFTANFPALGCGGDIFDCANVLNSKYSHWIGIPIILFAVLNYFVLIVSLVNIGFTNSGSKSREASWVITNLCGIAGGMAAIWFLFLQAFVLGHYCPLCIAIHSCGLIIVVTLFWKRAFRLPVMFAISSMPAIGIVALIFGQVSSEEPAKFQIIVRDGPNVDDDPNEDVKIFQPPELDDGVLFEAPKIEDEN